MSEQKKAYQCEGCTGICCSVYQSVPVTTRDIKRLTRHLRTKIKSFARSYLQTKTHTLLLRRKVDPILRETCIFFDTQKRLCGVYEARPQVCRDWPAPEIRVEGAEDRCAYFDLLQFARKEQGPYAVPLVQIVRVIPDEKRKAVG